MTRIYGGAALVLLALLAGCETTQQAATSPDYQKTRTGAGIGAGVGAVAGLLVGGNKFQSALIGAAIGGVAGGAIGNYQDKQEAQLRSSMAGTGVAAHGLIGRPANSASSASAAQELGSVPSTEWPVSGTTSRCEPGIFAASARASAVGVRRSSAPLRISVDTAGTGASSTSGPAVAKGHEAQAGMSLRSIALAVVKGAKVLAGRCSAAATASRRRTAGVEERRQGNCSSSQLVARYKGTSIPSSPLSGEPLLA